jgi:hypothetical protein
MYRFRPTKSGPVGFTTGLPGASPRSPALASQPEVQGYPAPANWASEPSLGYLIAKLILDPRKQIEQLVDLMDCRARPLSGRQKADRFPTPIQDPESVWLHAQHDVVAQVGAVGKHPRHGQPVQARVRNLELYIHSGCIAPNRPNASETHAPRHIFQIEYTSG